MPPHNLKAVVINGSPVPPMRFVSGVRKAHATEFACLQRLGWSTVKSRISSFKTDNRTTLRKYLRKWRPAPTSKETPRADAPQAAKLAGPSDIVLFPHQAAAVADLVDKFVGPAVCRLHMGLGSGKTFVAFTVARRLAIGCPSGRFLYVTLPTLVAQALVELARFTTAAERSRWRVVSCGKLHSLRGDTPWTLCVC